MATGASPLPLNGMETNPDQHFRAHGQEIRTEPPQGRLYHLDAVRSFCLVYGFFLHAATTDLTGQLWFVREVSSFFRMAAFFLVSGFFGAMLLRRMSVADFLRKRSLNLLVPLAAGLVLLNPVTIYLVFVHHNGMAHPADVLWGDLMEDAAGQMPWHLHFWFLMSLFVYSLLTPLLVAVAAPLATGRVLSGLNNMRRNVLLIALAACAGAGVVLGLGFFKVVLEPVLEATPFSWVVRITFNYLPFYCIGVLMFACAPVYRALHRPGLLALVAGALVFAALTVWLDGERASGVARVVYYAAKNFVILIVVAALLAAGEALFSREIPVVSYLGERIYTGYVLHFGIIYMLALGLGPLGLPSAAQYILIACGALAIACCLHGLVIVRSPLLQFLFNGKPLGERAKAAPRARG